MREYFVVVVGFEELSFDILEGGFGAISES
jgi:hypothetical protein